MTKRRPTDIIISVPGETHIRAQPQADMAELADAPDLGSGVPDVQVQVLLSACYGAESNHNGFDSVPFCTVK